ncbi:PIN domain-containing protein [Modestobacter sp. I12A-02628]|uniref:Ribonuclease VapC n=1 Tax=Goekera deserti TaxID=2497753 RepID=A0A7K3WIN8_9ACTN|nr:type II toxin-antitoxin system VapC family toxin [Goekera deserti]MPQ96459.1 PIN domain-containing protein [Goekera deserti]NDI47226.1 PIN domain-containing protein [Goekera deserti]NEL55373.1 type II toxin-antitoxin system VapC family toxin [Goekera deserti]
MIVYLDTSALIPLLVAEPASAGCRRIWDAAETVVCSELGFVEAAAALAQAHRLGRLSTAERTSTLRGLDERWDQMVALPVDMPLVRAAAGLAVEHGLRGYDAVHCAMALSHADAGIVAVSGDRALLDAWETNGLTVVDTNA